MRVVILGLVLVVSGCSTAPLAGTLDCLLPSRPRLGSDFDRWDEPRSRTLDRNRNRERDRDRDRDLDPFDEPRRERGVLPSPTSITGGSDITPRERSREGTSDLPR